MHCAVFTADDMVSYSHCCSLADNRITSPDQVLRTATNKQLIRH